MNLPTIKPLDTEAVVAFAKKVQHIVTAEEHQIAGGMGSAVAECLTQQHPIPMSYIGMHDEYGQSGAPDELIAYYGLDAKGIVKHIKSVMV